MTWAERKNRIVNVVMFSLTGLCTLVIIALLVRILAYLVISGGRYLSIDFFTKLPKPVGETGGGMANAIVGSVKLLLLASTIGLPIGFLGGVYLAEFGGKTFPFIVRYTTDLLNGVPSIVIGIFAYTLIVLPMRHFSTFVRRGSARHHDDPDRIANYGGVTALCADESSGRRACIRCVQGHSHHHCCDTRRSAGDHFRRDA